MLTRSVTNKMELAHIVDNVLVEADNVAACLQSINIEKIPAIFSLTKTRLRAATYKDPDGKDKTIDDATFHHIWAFKKYIGFLCSHPDPDQRIKRDFLKIDCDSFYEFYSGIYDTETSDLDPESKKLAIDMAQRAYDQKMKSTANALASNVNPVRPLAEEFRNSIKRDVTHSYNTAKMLHVHEKLEVVKLSDPAKKHCTQQIVKAQLELDVALMETMEVTAPAMVNFDGEAAPASVNSFAVTLTDTTADVSRIGVKHEVESPYILLDPKADWIEARKDIPDKAHD